MDCPKCHKPKESKDFYWHKDCISKVYPECKSCVKQRWEKKKKGAIVVEGMFNETEFKKYYTF